MRKSIVPNQRSEHVGGGVRRLLVEGRGKEAVSRRGGPNRMLVEGRGKQVISGGGGANRMLVEGEGQTGC